MALKSTLAFVTCLGIFGFSGLVNAEDPRLVRDAEGRLVYPVMGLLNQYKQSSLNQKTQNAGVVKLVKRLKQELGGTWFIEWNAQGTGLQTIVRDPLDKLKKKNIPSLTKLNVITTETIKNIANIFLRQNASLFQLPTDLTDFRVLGVHDYGSGFTRHCCVVGMQQVFNGLPVFEGRVYVYVDQNGVIDAVDSRFLPSIAISTTPILSATDAINAAKEDTLKKWQKARIKSGKLLPASIEEQEKLFPVKPNPKLGIHKSGKKPELAYSFDLQIALEGRVTGIEYIIDANNSKIIEANDYSHSFN